MLAELATLWDHNMNASHAPITLSDLSSEDRMLLSNVTSVTVKPFIFHPWIDLGSIPDATQLDHPATRNEVS